MMTAEAIETLAGSGALTPLGDRFVDGMRATVEPWLERTGRAGRRVVPAHGPPSAGRRGSGGKDS